jgi:hypothetical protein
MTIIDWTRITRDVVVLDSVVFLDGTGASVTPDSLSVALIQPWFKPEVDTVWTAASGNPPQITLAGPDADTLNALEVPPGGADLWVRAIKGGVVLAARFGRIVLHN